jgi:hypothetical protein
MMGWEKESQLLHEEAAQRRMARDGKNCACGARLTSNGECERLVEEDARERAKECLAASEAPTPTPEKHSK